MNERTRRGFGFHYPSGNLGNPLRKLLIEAAEELRGYAIDQGGEEDGTNRATKALLRRIDAALRKDSDR